MIKKITIENLLNPTDDYELDNSLSDKFKIF